MQVVALLVDLNDRAVAPGQAVDLGEQQPLDGEAEQVFGPLDEASELLQALESSGSAVPATGAARCRSSAAAATTC